MVALLKDERCQQYLDKMTREAEILRSVAIAHGEVFACMMILP